MPGVNYFKLAPAPESRQSRRRICRRTIRSPAYNGGMGSAYILKFLDFA
jgi:hypothetical protein